MEYTCCVVHNKVSTIGCPKVRATILHVQEVMIYYFFYVTASSSSTTFNGDCQFVTQKPNTHNNVNS